MKFSFIIPVYNRPDEVDELLESMAHMRPVAGVSLEVLIVEDGSSQPCRGESLHGTASMPVRYFRKGNRGPAVARNYGAERAEGDWFVFLDSDVTVPPGYLEAVTAGLSEEECDSFGGSDCSHPSFTPMQKAISYAMTSFFTTGGIRGTKGARLDKFYPRSFNMGVRREVFNAIGGFSVMRFGEDMDFSYRLLERGYLSRLLPEAWVWHKRRTDLQKFFRQVHASGMARINLSYRHPGTLKVVHLLPSVFTIGCGLCLIGILFYGAGLVPLLFFALLLFLDCYAREGDVHVAFLAVAAGYVQLIGYGTGFLRAGWLRAVRGKGEVEAFRKNFYK